MVRILVATVLREVIDSIILKETMCDDKEEGRLLQLIQAGKRELTAKAAPPDGLIFMGAIFS